MQFDLGATFNDKLGHVLKRVCLFTKKIKVFACLGDQCFSLIAGSFDSQKGDKSRLASLFILSRLLADGLLVAFNITLIIIDRERESSRRILCLRYRERKMCRSYQASCRRSHILHLGYLMRHMCLIQ